MPYLKALIILCFTSSIFNVNASEIGPWKLSASGFYLNSKTTFEARSPFTKKPLTISFEDDLKLTEKTFLPYYELSYEISNKHLIYLDWKKLKRSATNEVMNKSFDFSFDGNNNYHVAVNAKLHTELNVDIFRSGYQYNIFTNEKAQFDILLGVHVMKLDLILGGEIEACLKRSCTDEIVSADKTVFTNVTAPLPNFGASFSYNLSKNLLLLTKMHYLSLKIDEVKGRLIDSTLGAEYLFSNGFSIKLAYEFYDFDVDYQDDYKDLNLNFRFSGPILGISYQF